VAAVKGPDQVLITKGRLGLVVARVVVGRVRRRRRLRWVRVSVLRRAGRGRRADMVVE
jgi:hypothetical protein